MHVLGETSGENEDKSQEILASGSKAVGDQAGEEEVKVLKNQVLFIIPKDYVKMKYTDRMSGDVLLVGPPPGRKIEDFMDGMFLIVECKLYGCNVLWDMVNSALIHEPYEGSETEGEVVIDLIELNSLVSLPRPSDRQLSKYLNEYMDRLFPLLEEQKVANELKDW